MRGNHSDGMIVACTSNPKLTFNALASNIFLLMMFCMFFCLCEEVVQEIDLCASVSYLYLTIPTPQPGWKFEIHSCMLKNCMTKK